MNKRLLLACTLACITQTLTAFWPFSEPHELTESERIDSLLAQQASSPDDPEISYNLGVARYKNKQIAQAQVSFEQALTTTTINKFPELMERCLFNAGNCGVKHTLSTLPKGWEKSETEVQNEILSTAIATLKKSVTHFAKLLDLKKSNKAEKNKERAEDLIKKLEEKLKQQQQEQKGENKKNDSQEKQDSEKQSQDKKEVGDNQSKGDKNQENSGGQQGGKDSTQTTPDGKNDRSSNENDKNNQNRNSDEHDQPPQDSPPQPSSSESTQSQSEKQEKEKESTYNALQGEKPDEDIHDKSMQALLESLDNDASQTHKELLRRKTEQENHHLGAGQKPW